MSVNILDKAEKFLINSEELLVPLKTVWDAVGAHASGYEFLEFIKIIDSDNRFYIGEWEKREFHSNMDAYMHGPHVVLMSKNPDINELLEQVEKKLNDLHGSISKAYFHHAPDSSSEDQLLALLQHAESLRHETKNVLKSSRTS